MKNHLRIVGGSPADIKDYPYQVLLMIDGKASCGGSIIRNNYILTAAHCIYDVSQNQVTIRAGSTDRTTGGQVTGVKTITYPKDQFNIDTYDYDVAILELDTPLVFSETVAVVEMAAAGDDVIPGEVAKATGWGQTDPNDDTLPNILQAVDLPEITTQTCKNYYGSLITSRMFCAGYKQGGKDTCLGDSGGPLVADGLLLGITSWGGDTCAAAGYPGVFTKVSYFREYIDDVINSLDSSKVVFRERVPNKLK